MEVDDVGAHAIQEVLRVRDEYKDSLEPDKKNWDEEKRLLDTCRDDIERELTTWALPPTTHKRPDPSG